MKSAHKLTRFLLKRRRKLYFRFTRVPLYSSAAQDAEFWELHQQLLEDGRCTQLLRERYNLWTLGRQVQPLPGDYAEAGVYDGGSARILCAVKQDAHLHLFDTFEGMPQVDRRTDPWFVPGQFGDTSKERVAEYLSPFKNVHFHQGLFPASAADVPQDRVFKFVHLDFDVYPSTVEALKFFYPRLVHRGMIVAHDYGNVTAPGVKRAFDEFAARTGEHVVPLWETQCLVIKSPR